MTINESSTLAPLTQLINERALQRNVQVKLASGASSQFYIDCKKMSLHGPSLLKLSQILVAELEKLNPRPDAIAGVSVGGDPLVAGVLLEAAKKGWSLEGLLVRKEKKAHGLSSGRAVDGVAGASLKNVWLLEDVITSGGSSQNASQHLLDEGYPLKGIICLVDREAGGVEKLEQQFNIPVLSLTRLSALGR